MTKSTVEKIRVFAVIAALLFIVVLYPGCQPTDKTEPIDEVVKGDVQVTVVDKYGEPISETEVIVQGMSNIDMAEVCFANINGTFLLKNVSERNLDFIIHTDEKSYIAHYTVTKSDIERGSITVTFSDYDSASHN